ncbi:MAG: polysaccharide pyruvyl transferase family protein [Kiloniellaceae bacterium]
MKIYFYRAEEENFGDELNLSIWPKVFGDYIDGDGQYLCGIGSILDSRLCDLDGKKIIFGVGARGPGNPIVFDDTFDVRFVRGPRTAALYDGVEFITDPGILIAEFKEVQPRGSAIGLVGYFRSDQTVWREVCSEMGMQYISPNDDVETVLQRISECKRVFCEAMHGAIAADALRIPWRPVSGFNAVHEHETHKFKWEDWCHSMDLEFDPLKLPPIWRQSNLRSKVAASIKRKYVLRKIDKDIKDDSFFLSDNKLFRIKVRRILSEINDLKRDM